MKSFLFFFILIINFELVAQNNYIETTFFVQSKFEINDQIELRKLENNLKLNPFIKLVRLDYYSQRSFILTKDLSELTEAMYFSWFENFSNSLSCVQIGVYGVDKINVYPFNNCNNLTK